MDKSRGGEECVCLVGVEECFLWGREFSLRSTLYRGAKGANRLLNMGEYVSGWGRGTGCILMHSHHVHTRTH